VVAATLTVLRLVGFVGYGEWHTVEARWVMADDFDDQGSEEQDAGSAAKGRTPPYIGYSTFKTMLSELKTNGLPPQIDRSVLVRFAGGLQGQLMHALRSLGLTDDDKKPTPKLKRLVDAYETPEYAAALRPIIDETYPYVLQLDLMSATPSMFADAFKKAVDAKEDVLRKCRTFFLHAARDIGITVGPRIEKAKFPRSSNGATRKPKAAKAGTPAPTPAPTPAHTPAAEQISDKALEYKLIDLMRDDDIDDEQRAAIWTLVQYLTAKAKKKAASETPTAP
jgi:hypothetical protein